MDLDALYAKMATEHIGQIVNLVDDSDEEDGVEVVADGGGGNGASAAAGGSGAKQPRGKGARAPHCQCGSDVAVTAVLRAWVRYGAATHAPWRRTGTC